MYMDGSHRTLLTLRINVGQVAWLAAVASRIGIHGRLPPADRRVLGADDLVVVIVKLEHLVAPSQVPEWTNRLGVQIRTFEVIVVVRA
jgi:hypothetical protein